MYDLTCAHRSLPLGTWVKVTNLHTRKWIVVRVNDRGPVPDTRIADLSSEAAYMLGMRARGVTRVRLDVIDPKAAVEIVRLDRIRMAREAAEQSSIETGNYKSADHAEAMKLVIRSPVRLAARELVIASEGSSAVVDDRSPGTCFSGPPLHFAICH